MAEINIFLVKSNTVTFSTSRQYNVATKGAPNNIIFMSFIFLSWASFLKDPVHVLKSKNSSKFEFYFISETIRLYPSLPFLIRSCSKRYEIPNSKVHIDKGVCIIIPVVGLHRDPKYYENPNVFNPQNFSEEVKNSRHHCTYLPFGDGPRICIGKLSSKISATLGRPFSKILNNRSCFVFWQPPNLVWCRSRLDLQLWCGNLNFRLPQKCKRRCNWRRDWYWPTAPKFGWNAKKEMLNKIQILVIFS